MQQSSFTPHLFHLRRTVNAAVKVLHDCSIVERELRLKTIQLENGSTIGPALLASARGRTFAMRWRAQDVIIRAGAALLVLCVAIDKSGMTVGDKVDLLGCRHRCRELSSSIEFARLLGDGRELAPIDCNGTADMRAAPLRACGLVMLDHAFLEQHAALRPAV